MKQKLYKEKQALWNGLKISSHQFGKHTFKIKPEVTSVLARAVLKPPSVRPRQPWSPYEETPCERQTEAHLLAWSGFKPGMWKLQGRKVRAASPDREGRAAPGASVREGRRAPLPCRGFCVFRCSNDRFLTSVSFNNSQMVFSHFQDQNKNDLAVMSSPSWLCPLPTTPFPVPPRLAAGFRALLFGCGAGALQRNPGLDECAEKCPCWKTTFGTGAPGSQCLGQPCSREEAPTRSGCLLLQPQPQEKPQTRIIEYSSSMNSINSRPHVLKSKIAAIISSQNLKQITTSLSFFSVLYFHWKEVCLPAWFHYEMIGATARRTFIYFYISDKSLLTLSATANTASDFFVPILNILLKPSINLNKII